MSPKLINSHTHTHTLNLHLRQSLLSIVRLCIEKSKKGFYFVIAFTSHRRRDRPFVIYGVYQDRITMGIRSWKAHPSWHNFADPNLFTILELKIVPFIKQICATVLLRALYMYRIIACLRASRTTKILR